MVNLRPPIIREWALEGGGVIRDQQHVKNVLLPFLSQFTFLVFGKFYPYYVFYITSSRTHWVNILEKMHYLLWFFFTYRIFLFYGFIIILKA